MALQDPSSEAIIGEEATMFLVRGVKEHEEKRSGSGTESVMVRASKKLSKNGTQDLWELRARIGIL